MVDDKSLEVAEVRCPYCGVEQLIKGCIYGMNLTSCDSDQGGCDKYFAYTLKKSVRADARMIEGEVRGDLKTNNVYE